MRKKPYKANLRKAVTDPHQTLRDILLTLTFSKKEALSLLEELEANPERERSISFEAQPPKVLRAISGGKTDTNTPTQRRESAQKTLEGILTSIERATQGQISREDVAQELEEVCQTKVFSILHTSIYNWKELPNKVKIFEEAGTTFEKANKDIGTIGAGTAYRFLKVKQVDKEIANAKETAKELPQAFQNQFKKAKASLQKSGRDVPDHILKGILAEEILTNLHRKPRNEPQPKSAQHAAEILCARCGADRLEEKNFPARISMTLASLQFVEEKVPSSLREYILENPIPPLFAKEGREVIHHKGKPLPNPDIPEELQREAREPIRPLLAKAKAYEKEHPESQGILPQLIDALRLPPKRNIPIKAAFLKFTQEYPHAKEWLKKSTQAQMEILGYGITHSTHSAISRAFAVQESPLAGNKAKETARNLLQSFRDFHQSSQQIFEDCPRNDQLLKDLTQNDQNYAKIKNPQKNPPKKHSLMKDLTEEPTL